MLRLTARARRLPCLPPFPPLPHLPGLRAPRIVAACIVQAPLLVAPAAAQVSVGEPFLVEQEAVYQPSFRDQETAAVCAGPGEYFAVFADTRIEGGASRDLYGQRIRPDGTVVAPGSIELALVPGFGVAGVPAVAWNGSVYLVTWCLEEGGLWGLRVDAEGRPLAPGQFLIDAQPMQRWPAVASDGTDFLVVYSTAASVVSAKRIGEDGTVLDAAPLALSSGATDLGIPKVGWGAGFYAAVWTQLPAQAIRGCRVSSAGEVLDPGGDMLSGGGLDIDPHIDFDGENFYIVWQRRRGGGVDDIFGAHVDPESFSPTSERLLLDGSWGPVTNMQLAWNGARHLLSLTEPVGFEANAHAMLINADGFASGDPFPVSTIEGSLELTFGLAAAGSQWLVVYHRDWWDGGAFINDTNGARIDSSGAVLDPQQDGIVISTAASRQITSAAAFDGTSFLCILEDRRDPPQHSGFEAPVDYFRGDLRGVRVSREGAPLDAASFHIAGGPRSVQREPHAAFGGGQYFVAYVNEGTGSSDEIRLTRLAPDGTVLDPEGILVVAGASGLGFLREPEVAATDDACCVVWGDDHLSPGEQPVQFAVFGHDGTLRAGPASLPAVGAHPEPHVASDGDGFLVVWSNLLESRAARISGTGAVSPAAIINNTGGAPRIAWNGSSYLAVWTEWISTPERASVIRARPIGPDGIPSGPAVTLTEPTASPRSCEAVFGDGSGFALVLTAWEVLRVDAAGAPTGGPTPFALADPPHHPGFFRSWATDGEGAVLTISSAWAGGPYNADRAWGQMILLDSACSADCDDSGALDFFDFLCFQDQFAAGGAEADCDASGSLDFFDFLCFQDAFAAGCP